MVQSFSDSHAQFVRQEILLAAFNFFVPKMKTHDSSYGEFVFSKHDKKTIELLTAPIKGSQATTSKPGGPQAKRRKTESVAEQVISKSKLEVDIGVESANSVRPRTVFDELVRVTFGPLANLKFSALNFEEVRNNIVEFLRYVWVDGENGFKALLARLLEKTVQTHIAPLTRLHELDINAGVDAVVAATGLVSPNGSVHIWSIRGGVIFLHTVVILEVVDRVGGPDRSDAPD